MQHRQRGDAGIVHHQSVSLNTKGQRWCTGARVIPYLLHLGISFHSGAAAFPCGTHFSSVSQSPAWSGMYGFISAVLEFHWISIALKQESIFEIHQEPISFRTHEVSISQNANVEVCVVYMWGTLWSSCSGRRISLALIYQPVFPS